MTAPVTDCVHTDTQHPNLATSRVLDIPFANISLESALARLADVMTGVESHSLYFINAHCLNTTFDDDRYRQALRSAELIFPDGSGVRKGCQLQGETLLENLNGTDLFPHLCRLCADAGQPIFLLGAAPGVADRVAAWAERHAPGLVVAGTQHGYFPPEHTPEVIATINASGARVLFVAMGVPRQELWIAKHRQALDTVLNIAVGGLFDFFSDTLPRAPLWMRQRGIEWAWRLMQEPGRMWRRYLLGNPLFMLRLWRDQKARAFKERLASALGEQRRHRWLARRAAVTQAAWRWSHHRRPMLKRALDLIASGSALILLMPLGLMVVLAIRLDSPGPVFFRQCRVGYRGRPFMMWKFRSMYRDAEARRAALEAANEMDGGVLFKMENDPRVTRVGRVIRRLSIDELPQLWNVFLGHMAMVGPRPALPGEVAQYSPAQRQRLDTKPGLTSDWAVSGRSNLSFIRQAELDIDYVHRPSLWRDLVLLLKTIPAMLTGRGAR
ncbi:WecB/TagA/CpsF family glycosyltransferase [Onishia taeanensis]